MILIELGKASTNETFRDASKTMEAEWMDDCTNLETNNTLRYLIYAATGCQSEIDEATLEGQRGVTREHSDMGREDNMLEGDTPTMDEEYTIGEFDGADLQYHYDDYERAGATRRDHKEAKEQVRRGRSRT
eukprot:3595767-Heterocapsa_arctica.AAC.1